MKKWIPASIILWVYVVTAARAIRAPHEFSQAYWLVDYQSGFIKRGLVGTVCSYIGNAFNHTINPVTILVFSSLAYAAMAAAMLFLLYRLSRRGLSPDRILLVGLVFMSSPFVVMSADLVGYFDSILYILAMVSTWLVLQGRPFSASILCVMAILVHESYLLIGLPLVCLATFSKLQVNRNSVRASYYIVALCIPVIVFAGLVIQQAMATDVHLLRSQLAQHLHSFLFISNIADRIAEWQTTPFVVFFDTQHKEFLKRLLNPAVVQAVLPTLVVLLIFIYQFFQISIRSVLSLVILAAVLAPLAMHAVAWDTVRISTYCIASAYMALWILAETHKVNNPHYLLPVLAFPVFIWNIFGTIVLMDGDVERLSFVWRLGLYLPAIAVFLKQVKELTQGEKTNGISP